MIKRRFYKQERGDNSGSSESSSSDDSDSFPEVDIEEDHEVEEEEEEEEEEQGRRIDKNTLRYPSPGSGYESEDSSNTQGDDDISECCHVDPHSPSDLLTNKEDASGESIKDSKTVGKEPYNEVEMDNEMTGIAMDLNDSVQTDISNFILKFKSVFKCRLCPRILCLNEDTVRTHLSSKRHARSRKLHDEGRLKLMLNSDGELEEEQETHAERHARILALSQKPNPPKIKNNGRQRQNRPRKKREPGVSNKGKLEPSIKKCSKKRRTVEN